MPLHRPRHTIKSTAGPSIIVKRIQEEDSFIDFCEWNKPEQWRRIVNKHRTEALFREDPLAIKDYSVPYSLDKKGRWDLPEIIDSTIEDLQNPDLNLRVSASVHTCSRADPALFSWEWAKRAPSAPEEQPTTAFHKVTRSGEVQHKRAKRAALNTLEFPNRTQPERCLPKEDDKMFQKLHVRYTILNMTSNSGAISKSNRPTSTKHRRRSASPEDFSNLDFLIVDDELFFGHNDVDDDMTMPSTRTLADFLTTRSGKRRKTRKTKRKLGDEEIAPRFTPSSTISDSSSTEDFEEIPKPLRLTANKNLAGAVGKCSVCCETGKLFTLACGHTGCVDCFIRQMQSSLGDASYEVECMNNICTHIITSDEARCLLDSESFVRLRILTTDLLVQAGKARFCPQCHRGLKFSGNKHDDCVCGARLCGIESLYEIIPSITRITGLVRCPGCEVPMQRERGCSQMTCLCGVQFCYNCGKERDGPHNSATCRRQHLETIVLMDVINLSEFLTFPMKNLREAVRRRTEINARKREIKDALKKLSTSTRRRILRTLSAMTLLHESSILRAHNHECNRLRAGRIELSLCLFLNTKSGNLSETVKKYEKLDQELHSFTTLEQLFM